MRPPWFVRGDIDGFFGLFIDNLLQLMLIAVLGKIVCGFPPDLITRRILPGAAVSILIGKVLSMVGLIRAFELTPSGLHNRFGIVAAPEFAIMYGLSAAFLVLLHYRGSGDSDSPQGGTS